MSYLIEMKEENDRLLQVVQNIPQQQSVPKAKEKPMRRQKQTTRHS